MRVHNGLRKRPILTQNSLQGALSETVRGLQGDASDREFADEWRVSEGTVPNVRNKKHTLSLQPFLQLGERFGPSALDTVLSLINARAVDRDEVFIDVSRVPCDVAKVLPLLIELFADGECCEADVRKLDQAGAIDCLGKVADMLRNRRDAGRVSI